MRTEEVGIPFTRYRDPGGRMACAADFNTGAVCVFYATRNFGTEEMCAYGGRAETLRRRGDDGHGSLIPCEMCLVWKPEERAREAMRAQMGG